MLEPAQLYRDELKKALISCWYNPRYKYYFGSGRYEHELANNTDWKQEFVQLDDNGKVVGYFGYNYNDCNKALTNFGLIGFTENNFKLVRAALCRVAYLFFHGAQRAEFWCYADNPIKPWYDSIVTRYGGKQIATLHRTDWFDGEYHDMCVYEILVEDFQKAAVNLPPSILLEIFT